MVGISSRDPRSIEQWQALHKDLCAKKAQGMSVETWCRENQISVGSLYGKLKTLNLPPPGRTPQGNRTIMTTTPHRSGYAQVKFEKFVAASDVQKTITIKRGDICITIPPDTELFRFVLANLKDTHE